MNGRVPRVLLLAALLLLAAVLLFFHKMVFSNLILARGDTFLYFYPYWQAAADALRAGRVPLWNPALFMGAPFLANSQAGFFYPPNWPLWALLETPYAASAAIVAHVFLAGLGTYLAARRWLALDPLPALLAGLAFALGGYLTAQVEHINQLQGLAWLPWFLWVLGGIGGGSRRAWLRGVFGLAVLFAVQLLAGHTQTTFISGTAVLIWTTAVALGERRAAGPAAWRGWLARQAALLAGGGLALLLSAAQLLPTLELAGLSSREGGLAVNEVLSFSLPPVHLARALLPGYGQSLFSEYVAFLPLSFLALAFLGAWQWRSRPAALAALVLAAAGLFLALGVANPLYWLLARLPGFDLFRAPARWLALYALGAALLAGLGAQIAAQALRRGVWRDLGRPLRWFLLLLLALMVWAWLAGPLAALLPPGPEAPYAVPSLTTVAGWLLELALLLVLLALAARRPGAVWLPALAALGLAFLFLASRALPYNNLTTPEATFDLRPSAARLIAEGGEPPERFLSLSAIFFDPGDQEEIRSIYADQLPPEALYDYLIAIKQKEIIAPNLPLIYGLAAVDGFDGGILPLRAWSQQMALLLPPGESTTDGRLREQLTAVPEQRWLNLYNTRYLITDKTGDLWRDGVFFDRQHPSPLAPGQAVDVGFLPDYEATELRLLADGAPTAVTVTDRAGTAVLLEPQPLGDGLYRAAFPAPLAPQALSVSGCAAPCTLEALTLVDARDETFLSLVPGAYRLIHSGDVKIYENLRALPRAFLLDDWTWAADAPGALAQMGAAGFDPAVTAVLLRPEGVTDLPQPGPAAAGGTAVITSYAPEEVLIRAESPVPALLLLSDAAYPGWTATINGAAAPLYVADGLFRAVYLPAGAHDVAFRFAPGSYANGRILSLLGLLLLAALGLAAFRPRSANAS